MTPGLIKRAGMAGIAYGLDYGAALALAPEGVDREALAYLLRRAEAGLMAGFKKLAKD